MPKNTYETLLILDSNQYARDPGGVTKSVDQTFADAGAQVEVSRLWMERKLEYPIKKHQKGTYWLVYSVMEGDSLPKLDRALHLAEPVLRQLTIKLDARLVEPILANARGQSIPTPEVANRSNSASDVLNDDEEVTEVAAEA